MTFKTKKLLASLTTTAVFLIISAQNVFAVSFLNSIGEGAGYDTGVGGTALPLLVGYYINILLSLLGIIFFVLTIYAGYMWMMARENADQAKKAMTLLKNAVIGLVIIFAAYSISYFVVSRISAETLATPPTR